MEKERLQKESISEPSISFQKSLECRVPVPENFKTSGSLHYIKPDEINRVTASFEEIIDRSMESVDYVNKILTSDYLKMSDAERATVLKDYETRSNEMVAEVQNKTRRYKEIISFRKMQDKINNRETGY